MTTFHPPLPELPPVPTVPMDPSSRRQLLEALGRCRPILSHSATRAHVSRAYACLWIHLALERALDVRKTVSQSSRAFQDVQAAFLEEARILGLHDRLSLLLQAPTVAAQACRLWQDAKAAQASLIPSLPGLEMPGSTPPGR